MVVYFDDFTITRDNFIWSSMEIDWVNRHTVVVRQSIDRYRVSHIIQQNFAFCCANSNLHSLRRFKFNLSDFLILATFRQNHIMDLAFRLHVPKLYTTIDTASSCELKLRWVVDTIDLRRVRDQRRLESAHGKVKSVNLVGCSDCHQISRVRIVTQVATEFWNSNFEVFSILCVELDIAVSAKESQLGVVFGEDTHL